MHLLHSTRLVLSLCVLGAAPAAAAQLPITINTTWLPDVCPNSGDRSSTKCEEWSRIWNPAGMESEPKDQAVAPNGATVFVTGIVHDYTNAKIEAGTVAYNAATGQLLWSARIPDAAGMAVTVHPGGQRVYVSGSIRIGSVGYALTVAYDAASGAELWRDTRTGSSVSTWNVTVDVDPGGNRVYVGGISRGYFVNGLDAASGAHLWQYEDNLVGAPGSDGSTIRSMAVSPNCSLVAVSGTSEAPFQFDGVSTVLLDGTNGNPVWVATHSGPSMGSGLGETVAFSPSGNRVFTTGGRWSGKYVSRHRWDLYAYDTATGNQVWSAKHDGWDEEDHPRSMAVAPDGSAIYLTGTELGAYGVYTYPQRLMLTAAFDADTGAELWATRFSALRLDAGWDVEVTPDGSRVVVAGFSRPKYVPTGYSSTLVPYSWEEETDNLVIAYEAGTGLEVWRNVWAGPLGGRIGWVEVLPTLSMDPTGERVFCSARRFLIPTVGAFGAGYLTLAFDLEDLLP